MTDPEGVAAGTRAVGLIERAADVELENANGRRRGDCGFFSLRPEYDLGLE
jgi:hypothetical protein